MCNNLNLALFLFFSLSTYIYIYIYIYIYCDSKTCDKEGSEFDLISSHFFETLIALTWDNFTVPFLSQVELGLKINAIMQ